MKNRKNPYIFLHLPLLSAIAISSSLAPKVTAENSVTMQEPLLANSRNISGNDFSALYMSKDPLKRQLAEMYINGALDTTEGKTWCSYNIASPDAVQEQIYMILKEAPKELLEKRASEIINFAFSKKLPCRAAK